jgi:hypothetical protein
VAVKERIEFITKLEKELDARLLVLVTGDRQGMETRIAPDVLPLISEHLSHVGLTETLALFLYTPGGDSIAGWGLVNLLRQYCNKLKVLVAFRALSCGTLITLGADEIIMGRHGLLSPIDPSVASPFNPPAPGIQQPGRISLLPVSVEDMIGFLDLARKEIGLKADDSMVEVLRILAEKVHPLALGAVYRAREQNSSLARRLLLSHSNNEGKINRIVRQLTQELPTHNYLIGRREASKEVELDVVEPDTEVERLMWDLYKDYEDWLNLTNPVSAELDLGVEDKKTVRYERACVESLHNKTLVQHIFITDKALFKMRTTPPGVQAPIDQTMERIIYEGWVQAEDGEVVKWR